MMLQAETISVFKTSRITPPKTIDKPNSLVFFMPNTCGKVPSAAES